MKDSIHPPGPNHLIPTSSNPSRNGPTLSGRHNPGGFWVWLALLTGLFSLLGVAPAARADQNPPGCTGSGLGILLYTDKQDVHVGDTLNYSITVFNGTGNGPIVCDASSITAFIVTPDGKTNGIPLVLTNMVNGDSEYISNAVSYVVLAQDIQPDGTVLGRAYDSGVIHQNVNDSEGGGNQGVNTMVSLPCIQLTMQCTGNVGQNGAITFSGMVTNCGNDTLVNVTVTNFVNGGQYPVAFITNILAGQVATYSGSWVPLNPCSPSTVTLEAEGTDQYTTIPRTVTSSITNTCSDVLTAGILVTKACPPTAVAPGQLLTFSGSVSNTGNVTLTGILVVNNQPVPNTAVFTLASLAPGAIADFTGSYLAPAACSVLDTLTATATSSCGVAVTNLASATCPIMTMPALTVIQNCPATPTLAGALLTYSGSVSNSGNILLTNVVVLNNLSGATPVLTAATLAPGATANFTGSYLAPIACFSISTATATGESLCGTAVTNTASTTCAITTTPALALTQTCPAVPPAPGALLTYRGTVTNTGNITLTNVVVLNNLSGATPVFTAATLAPGVGAGYTGSYLTPTNCSTTSTATATGESVCGVAVAISASSTCAIATTPVLTITQTCPVIPTAPGALLTYSGTVTNAGNITLTNVVVLNNLSGTTPVFTAATLAPGVGAGFTGSYLTPTNCSTTSTSTATGESVCGIAVTNSASSTCAIATTPVLTITQTCPAIPTAPGALLTYSGTVTNTGNIMITNVVVLNNLSGATPIFTATSLAPGVGASYTGSYLTPTNCSTTSTSTATGESVCGIAVTNSASSTCAIATTPVLTITQTCPAIPTAPGALLTYSGTVTNTGNIMITNVVVLNNLSGATPIFTATSLAPGVGASYTGSYLTPTNCSTTSTSTATGESVCGLAVNASVSATCAIVTTPMLTMTQNCPANPTVPGALLTYSGTVTNTGNITITNVVVLNNLSGATPLLTAANLAPGAGASYTGSYLTPTNCSTTSTSTATGESVCGVAVTNAASSTCAIITLPALTLTHTCPASPTAPGALLTYTDTVTNAGNITLTNIMVLNNLSGSTPVFTAATLAPGAGTSFTGSYLTPTNCSTTSTSTATGQSICGVGVTNTASSTCAVATAAELAITQTCPASPAVPGALLTYSGTVTNAGNITLTNVLVLNNLSGSSPIFTAATLAPGAGASFTGSYLTPTNCSTTSISTASGQGVCGAAITNTASATCEISTTPVLTLTQTCPVIPPAPGTLLTYNGTVTNTGNIIITNVVVLNNLSGSTPVYTAATLAPGTGARFTGSYLTPTNCATTSTSTATGQSVCGVPVSSTASATCEIATTPALTLTQTCPASPTAPGVLLTYTDSVTNAGNITLTNVVVLNNLSGSTPIFTAATLAPGAGASFTGSYLTPTNCSTTSTSTATGQSVCGVEVTNTASSTCIVPTVAELAITQTCPASPTVPGALLTYSDTVTNVGNIILTNVMVLNNLSGSTPIFTAATLAPGAGASFTGSYLTPTNCSTTSLSTASGRGVCGLATTNTASATCEISTTPALTLTQTCPAVPPAPGTMLTYGGTVTNTGNIIITNVVVLNNLSGSTPVYTAATLAPGAGARFTGSYVTPTNCATTSTSTATGESVCGIPVSSTASATCDIATAPALLITQACPTNPVMAGGLFTYTGSVSNAGDITLTNVVVVNNLSGVIFTAVTLLPMETTNFTGSYLAPTNCTTTSTSTATGGSLCGVAVTNSVTSTCQILTTPAIVVTLACPSLLPYPGGILTYVGSVSNPGNITLTNVIVVSDQPAPNTTVFKVATLAPGATASFTGSYQVPFDCCVVWSTLQASGQGCSGVTVTAEDTSACTVATIAQIVVTKVCTPGLLQPGDLLTYSGSVSNAGNITLIGVTLVDGESPNNSPLPGSIDLAPGQSVTFYGSYIVAPDFCGSDILTASGLNLCTFLPVAGSVTTTCPITTTPRLIVTKDCPLLPTPRGGLYTYSGSISNAGNVSLINVLVTNNYIADCYYPTNVLVLGPITLAPGASVNFTNSYIAPMSCCAVIDTLLASGQDHCSLSNVTDSTTTVCPLLTAPGIAVVEYCPAASIPMGSQYVYSGFVTNTGDAVLTNVWVFGPQGTNTPVLGPIELAPGQAETYFGTYTAVFNTSAFTVTAIGQDICAGNLVTNSASCPVLPTPSIDPVNNIKSVSFPTAKGNTYTVQYKNHLTDPVWLTLQSVPGTGLKVTVPDPVSATNSSRYYRIMVMP